jgi:hypothetical protein
MPVIMTMLSDASEVSHPLDLVEELPNGDERWVCPICGYERLVNLGPPPAHKTIMVNPGNFSARHIARPRAWVTPDAEKPHVAVSGMPIMNPHAPLVIGGACAACARR